MREFIHLYDKLLRNTSDKINPDPEYNFLSYVRTFYTYPITVSDIKENCMYSEEDMYALASLNLSSKMTLKSIISKLTPKDLILLKKSQEIALKFN